ncbi:MAG: hypothetical protein PVJ34_15615 [Anaerolineae bacterium]|jgi:hypothetical protein
MTTFPGSPRPLKGGLVLIEPETGAVQRIIVLQYNPETLTRTLQVQAAGEGGDRAEALRLAGPPVETYKLEAEIDAADQLEFPDENDETVAYGIGPQLAALETILYPANSALQQANGLASAGTLEIAPAEAPLTLFVWSKNRVLPVRITEFSVTEEAFDPDLNPLRAKVSLGLRVLSVNDLGFDHRGGNLFMTYHQGLERLAGKSPAGAFGDLGITGV